MAEHLFTDPRVPMTTQEVNWRFSFKHLFTRVSISRSEVYTVHVPPADPQPLRSVRISTTTILPPRRNVAEFETSFLKWTDKRHSSLMAFQPPAKQALVHGRQIFIYTNIRTNQTIYSLERSMNNTRALKQLPFLGKKTVPAALRKDYWNPLCVVTFPRSPLGLATFRNMTELKRLHETSWDRSEMVHTEGDKKGQPLSKQERGWKLMNQKPYAIADLAAALIQVSLPPTLEETAKAERMVRKDGRPKAKRGLGSKAWAEVWEARGVEGVRIRWTDMHDAEYAETWPEQVVHEQLGVARYTAAYPEAQVEVPEVGDDAITPAPPREGLGDE